MKHQQTLSCHYHCPSQEKEVGLTSIPTRPVENVVITTKGLQDRNNLLLDGRTVENKGKLIVWLIKPEVSLPSLLGLSSVLFFEVIQSIKPYRDLFF